MSAGLVAPISARAASFMSCHATATVQKVGVVRDYLMEEEEIMASEDLNQQQSTQECSPAVCRSKQASNTVCFAS
jgi:hypothetical protein